MVVDKTITSSFQHLSEKVVINSQGTDASANLFTDTVLVIGYFVSITGQLTCPQIWQTQFVQESRYAIDSEIGRWIIIDLG